MSSSAYCHPECMFGARGAFITNSNTTFVGQLSTSRIDSYSSAHEHSFRDFKSIEEMTRGGFYP